MFDLVKHFCVGAVFQGVVYIGVRVIPAQQGDDINQPVEFGLWVALDNSLELSKQRLDGIGAYQQWHLANCERTMDMDVFFEPGRSFPAA